MVTKFSRDKMCQTKALCLIWSLKSQMSQEYAACQCIRREFSWLVSFTYHGKYYISCSKLFRVSETVAVLQEVLLPEQTAICHCLPLSLSLKTPQSIVSLSTAHGCPVHCFNIGIVNYADLAVGLNVYTNKI